MRLINTTTLELKFFIGSKIPDYAILSHCWGDDEVPLQEFESSTDKIGPKSKKIRDCCELAVKDGLDWAWVDTCCIDKTSKVCYAFLDDVPENGSLAECRWFTRGWTLQELLAPELVRFYDQSRRNVGNKSELSQQLERATGVRRQYIQGDASVHVASIAQRMSWAAHRSTTREEDIAYCLMGVFDVNMPLLYGEGSKAFLRLQEHIIAQSEDESMFCWKAKSPPRPNLLEDPDVKTWWEDSLLSGVLATTP
ncbi:Putative heterokaryon incompatibility [Septoria linicola]|uniref:Heterokaryon incompatibility n=1 Tax=Septoria linicola TaxID=215465 RepID=A0A9Q9ARQ7_9PEZI|nr:putative heterokaryon incompatibility [Septoria linicola]USW50847.1 Putative heterokaryon incompatibility [Septoria linicola]